MRLSKQAWGESGREWRIRVGKSLSEVGGRACLLRLRRCPVERPEEDVLDELLGVIGVVAEDVPRSGPQEAVRDVELGADDASACCDERLELSGAATDILFRVCQQQRPRQGLNTVA